VKAQKGVLDYGSNPSWDPHGKDVRTRYADPPGPVRLSTKANSVNLQTTGSISIVGIECETLRARVTCARNGLTLWLVGHRQMQAYSYVRWSSSKQTKGYSLRRQTEMAPEYANEHGLTLDNSTYQDHGISAYRGDNVVQGKLGTFLKAIDNGTVTAPCYLPSSRVALPT